MEMTNRDPRLQARALYWSGWRLARIAEHLDLPESTVASWKRRDEWDAASAVDRVDATIEMRLVRLVEKEGKEGCDYKEIDLLGRQLERLARIRRYTGGGTETDLNPKIANRNKGPKKPPERNLVSEEQQERLTERFMAELFDYQKRWHQAGLEHRIRNLLKSRQIGATFYFAREALIDALTTARNQIFLSASKAQAHQFRSYICEFAKSEDVELRGDPITLPNGAQLIFLGTNSRTAQSYHGNLYVDEYFWIPRFQELRKVASAMASHARWRLTYFSTPSAITHEAYPFWTGELYNKGRAKSDHITLDVGHSALAPGMACADGQWRQIVTVEDAARGGCNLFDLDALRRENSPAEFEQLFLCQFIDDGASVFGLSMLQKCMVDSWVEWDDVSPLAERPFGSREVWLGYDPSLTGDAAALAIVAPPAVPGGKFRLLERKQFRGMDFAAQAEAIRAACNRYRVTHIGVDTSGLGAGVYQLVRQFRPDAVGYSYSVGLKTRLVLKAYDVISKGRFEFDAGATDVAAAFMSIRRTATASGRQVTYVADRSEETSHADLAWAVMHAIDNEPLEGATGKNSSIMEIY